MVKRHPIHPANQYLPCNSLAAIVRGGEREAVTKEFLYSSGVSQSTKEKVRHGRKEDENSMSSGIVYGIHNAMQLLRRMHGHVHDKFRETSVGAIRLQETRSTQTTKVAVGSKPIVVHLTVLIKLNCISHHCYS
jgi:hypothetical protein